MAQLRQHLRIKHHIPGRIRISFSKALTHEPQVREIANSRTAIPPGIHNVRLNSLARSVVIEYDDDLIPADRLEELITTRDNRRAVELLQEFNSLIQKLEKKEVN